MNKMAREEDTGFLIDFSVEENPGPKSGSPDQRKFEEEFQRIELSLQKAKEERQAQKETEAEKARSEEEIDDFALIAEEQFDFNVPCLSLSSSDESEEKREKEDEVEGEEDEEEVFFGPVGYMEKVVSKVVSESAPVPEPQTCDNQALSAAQWAELCIEAHKIARAIKDETKDASTVINRPVIPGFSEQIVTAPSRSAAGRRGTFTLDDSLDKEPTPPPKKHVRKGTFTLSSDEEEDDVVMEEEKQGEKEEEREEESGHRRSGSVESGHRRSGSVESGLQRSGSVRRSLRMSGGKTGLGSGCGIRSLRRAKSPAFRSKSPRVKARPSQVKAQSLKGPSTSTRTSPQDKVSHISPNSQTNIQKTRLSGGLLRPSAASSGLQGPSSRRSLGLKCPSTLPSKPSIKTTSQPPTTSTQPPATSSSLSTSFQDKPSQLRPSSKLPSKSKLAFPSASKPAAQLVQPAAQLVQPAAQLVQPASTAKPALKAPITKLDMFRTNPLQRRGVAGKLGGVAGKLGGGAGKLGALTGKLGGGGGGGGGVRGPMKATERHQSVDEVDGGGRQPLKSHVNGTEMNKPTLKQPASPLRRSIETTPVKQEKRVQPKRLMEGLETPPKKRHDSHAGSDSPGKVKSFLPTPTRSFTGPRRISACSSVSSVDSCNSPQLRGRQSPAVRRNLVSPATKLVTPIPQGRPKILRTPVNKENEVEPKRSKWSPIQRRPISREDEFIQCTKRSAINY